MQCSLSLSLPPPSLFPFAKNVGSIHADGALGLSDPGGAGAGVVIDVTSSRIRRLSTVWSVDCQLSGGGKKITSEQSKGTLEELHRSLNENTSAFFFFLNVNWWTKQVD